MRTRTTIILVLLLTAPIMAVVATAGTSFTEPGCGLSVSYPEGWAVQGATADGPSITLASDASVLERGPSPGTAYAMIFTGKVADFGGLSDPAVLAEAFAGSMASDGKVTSQSQIKSVTIQGQPGAMKQLSGTLNGQKGSFTVTALVSNGDDVAVMMGVDTTSGTLSGSIESIASSMSFGGSVAAADGAATDGAAAPSAEPVAAASPEEIEAAMQDLLASFTGDHTAIEPVLQRYAAANIDDPDTLAAYSLHSPEILSKEERDGLLCYSVRTQAGVTLRTWSICWQGLKIRSIKETAMGFVGQ